MNSRWISGNRVSLLINGDAFFPRVFECIAAAQHEVLLETFIWFEDKVGLALHAALLTAARRGVQIDLTIDGYGSPDLSAPFISALTQAGIRLHVFDPSPRLWGYRTNVFRRMHRKIVVVDGARAFVGGINYSADHLEDFGPTAKQDYAIEIEGPLVPRIQHYVRSQLLLGQGADAAPRLRDRLLGREPELPVDPALPAVGTAQALLATRDNRLHKSDIERHYRIAIRAARQRVYIANAYFFPGYRLLNQLRRAAKRGVDVRLILQGQPDMPIVKTAATLLYHHLLVAGVKIFEYNTRPLHGKVALTDNTWSTVGSSNLDPLSLALNLEANVIIRDRPFNQHLGEHLQQLMQSSCRQILIGDVAETGLWVRVRRFLVFHLLRHYPAWFGWLPVHTPRLTSAEMMQEQAGSDRVNEGQVS
ncbi:MAG: cardiolipin synthase ClsB [Gammaproteobacteria bacterium]|uniref:cardiolipin synthase ClsB n=1 Tax=Rhodoferax sp. TaxID=50421 RepID=UPI00179455E4|nr:cardiolipin synthase ClsB [Rhodoferax sp.]MBU3900613.1 cardiolipin synthase ClsB [Gammaproteobacteria bacterium]MBA3059092.1 cardiolipin synthase ClsB [Rhodoferax sp.]MBU3996724.1 cardiolipin synthase ClsB [Gammaproteobacteria bacterium]MBU4081011.1 cardiolipin synthase ClsB [Gammaproteobacteria bacterium]MBU4113177.1 cardiolipin synthase ClsB [Gammaproteobacteria bacterium]